MGNRHSSQPQQKSAKPAQSNVPLSDREVFERMDWDSSGTLTLDQILMPTAEGFGAVPSETHSPLVLFQFDESQEGSINYREFNALLKHIHKKQLQMKKKSSSGRDIDASAIAAASYSGASEEDHYRGLGSSAGSHTELSSPGKRTLGRPRSGSSGGEVHVSGRKSNENLSGSGSFRTNLEGIDLSRESGVPLITGRAPVGSNEPPRAIPSVPKLQKEARHFFERQMKTIKGRKRFLMWLFHLADIDRSGTISAPELTLILSAICNDGVELASLSFADDTGMVDSGTSTGNTTADDDGETGHQKRTQEDSARSKPKSDSDDDAPTPTESGGPSRYKIGPSKKFTSSPPRPAKRRSIHELSKQILEQYDTERTGELSFQEFMVLADLIARTYAVQVKYGADKIGPWLLRRQIGSGSSGVVRLALHEDDYRDRRAVKIIPKGDVADMSRIDAEIKAMLMLRHERIVQLTDVLEDTNCVFFVMEICGGGSVADTVALEPLDETTARYYFGQLLEGVSYCHSQGVVHRDLKLENCLLDNEGELKITDFGHSGIFASDWDIFSPEQTGTLTHVAPEQLRGESYSGEKLDAWACGIVLYRMVVGSPPFNPARDMSESGSDDDSSDSSGTQISKASRRKADEFMRCILACEYDIPDNVSADIRSLLSKLLRSNPDKRWSVARALSHHWLTSGKRTKRRLLRRKLELSTEIDSHVYLHAVERFLQRKQGIHVLRTRLAVTVTTMVGSLCDEMLRCIDPTRDMKFVVTVKAHSSLPDSDSVAKDTTETPLANPNPTGKHLHLLFQLKEGEAFDFTTLVDRKVCSELFERTGDEIDSHPVYSLSPAQLVKLHRVMQQDQEELAQAHANVMKMYAKSGNGKGRMPPTSLSHQTGDATNALREEISRLRQALSLRDAEIRNLQIEISIERKARMALESHSPPLPPDVGFSSAVRRSFKKRPMALSSKSSVGSARQDSAVHPANDSKEEKQPIQGQPNGSRSNSSGKARSSNDRILRKGSYQTQHKRSSSQDGKRKSHKSIPLHERGASVGQLVSSNMSLPVVESGPTALPQDLSSSLSSSSELDVSAGLSESDD